MREERKRQKISCACLRERERERASERVSEREGGGQSATASIPSERPPRPWGGSTPHRLAQGLPIGSGNLPPHEWTDTNEAGALHSETLFTRTSARSWRTSLGQVRAATCQPPLPLAPIDEPPPPCPAQAEPTGAARGGCPSARRSSRLDGKGATQRRGEGGGEIRGRR